MSTVHTSHHTQGVRHMTATATLATITTPETNAQQRANASDGLANYTRLDTILGTRSRRNLEYATYGIRHDNGDIGIVFHATEIVRLHPDGRATLNTGGWYTVNTLRRMNDYTGRHVAVGQVTLPKARYE